MMSEIGTCARSCASVTELPFEQALARGARAYGAEHEKIAREFAAEHAPALKEAAKSMIAVSSDAPGASCFGALIGRELSRGQGVLAKPVPAASFFKPGTSEVDWPRFSQLAADFYGGRLVSYPLFDPLTGRTDALSSYLGGVAVLILDGVGLEDLTRKPKADMFYREVRTPRMDQDALYASGDIRAVCSAAMLNDTLLLDAERIRLGKALMAEAAQALSGREQLVVGISGPSGTGKSELAYVLTCALNQAGIRARNMSGDSFNRIDPPIRKQWRVNRGIESVVGRREIDLDLFARVIGEFKAGRRAEVPVVDLVTDHTDTLTVDYAGVRVLVLDGLYAVSLPDLDLRIYIEMNKKAEEAQIKRQKEVLDEARRKIMAREAEEVAAVREYAGLLIKPDNTLARAR